MFQHVDLELAKKEKKYRANYDEMSERYCLTPLTTRVIGPATTESSGNSTKVHGFIKGFHVRLRRWASNTLVS